MIRSARSLRAGRQQLGSDRLAILVDLRVRLQEVGVDLGLRVRRFDYGDPDAPRAQLMVERLRITFDRGKPSRAGSPIPDEAAVTSAILAFIMSFLPMLMGMASAG